MIHPSTTKPVPWKTVLLVHYYPDEDLEPAVSTGFVDDDGVWHWDNLALADEGLEVHAYMDLPLIPERP